MELGSLLSVSCTFLCVWGPEMPESSKEAGVSEHEHIHFSLLFTVDGTWPLQVPTLPCPPPGDAICELP